MSGAREGAAVAAGGPAAISGGAVDGGRSLAGGVSGAGVTGAALDGARFAAASAVAFGCESVSGSAVAGVEADGALVDGVPAIGVRHLSFAYPESAEPVLSDVSFDVPQGAFALLVGDTGSGKSTLLSLLKPQVAPAGTISGEALVFGRPVASLSAEESARTVGFVFQDPDNQVVCDSVWHEMAFGLENLGTPQDQMRRRVAEMSYFFGIEPWFRMKTDELSGGRKQLLALASTLVMQPRILLLDEPTAQLDPIAAKNFAHALFRVNRELGCTVVVATHAPELLANYATCAFRLHNARVEVTGDGEVLPCGGGDASPASAASATTVSEPATSASAASTSPASATQVTGLRRLLPHVPQHSSPQIAESGDVWFRYSRDADWVLRGLDLQVATGDIHALVGGNGSGKSTILKLLAGVCHAQKGRVRAPQSGRALLPQDPKALFAEETVKEELMEWARDGGYGPGEASAMLCRMGLEQKADLHPYDLSGGQRQLLALGKLLLMKPSLLLLDEPTKGLDARSRRLVAEALSEQRACGVTMVVATHDLDFVQACCGTVSMVFDGETACTEPVDEFFHNNLFYRP
ncbi:MAG: ATP-binding cassette domain-containing protein [Coriobacteriaceae bacterium]|nr:ATP-binding cassette domain-containing protein [Coriobacteriaceae bacterium]